MIAVFKTIPILCIFSIILGCDVEGPNGYLWNKEDISVCWDDNITLTTETIGYLEDAIYQEWDKHIRLNFTGWGMCSDTISPDIVIQEVGQSDLTENGAEYSGMAELGMPLELPNNIYIAFSNCKDSQNQNLCIQGILLHEFGHVLNLRHEQSRIDTPQWCTDFLVETGYKAQSNKIKQNLVGPWSIDSIMNYCGDALVPDKWDIIEVQEYYPR